MTLRHIRIFLAVCEQNCNSTKAAEALHMTQPAVSLAIRELEQYYGVALFDRISRRLRLTEAGQRFREYAFHISALFEDMEKSMKNWDSFGVLRVGASITIGSQFLPAYVKEFRKLYPNTDVRCVVAPSDQLEQKILNSELDLALIEGIPHSPSLISEDYMEDQLCVICPADGTFQAGECLSIDTFRQQKFLLREAHSGTREVFDRATKIAGFSVEPIWEAMSTTALINAVIAGLGVAVLPYRMLSSALEQGQVIPIQVEGLDFKRRFRMIYHREKLLTRSAQTFMDLCRRSADK